MVFRPVMYIMSVVGVGGYLFCGVDYNTFSALYKDAFFNAFSTVLLIIAAVNVIVAGSWFSM